MRYRIHSFGCRASQADGAAIEAQLREAGLRLGPDAEWLVLNTCTVTAAADADLRRMVRREHQLHPDLKIAVTGCYAQRAPEEIAAMPGVSLVVGNARKHELVQLMTWPRAEYHGEVVTGDVSGCREFLSAPVEGPGLDRARPNLKIQDGCGNRCSFCIIPSVRGRSRSAPADQVVDQVRSLEGFAEVVLTGINLGRWGREQGMNLRISDLLERLLRETRVRRLRLSSIEPMDWSGELLDRMAGEPRVADHVHAPLQSGSDAVLKRMFRKYRTRHYESRIRLARERMPHCAVGADVMAGFPGETAAEFEETVAFVERLPFTYLHVFTYSERPGTAAAEAGDPVPVAERRRRTAVLRDLSDRKARAFAESQAGREVVAATLHQRGRALTSNFLNIGVPERLEPNQLVVVRVEPGAEGLMGVPV